MDAASGPWQKRVEALYSLLTWVRTLLKAVAPPVKSEVLRVIFVPVFMLLCISLFVGSLALHQLRLCGLALMGSSDPRTFSYSSPVYRVQPMQALGRLSSDRYKKKTN